MSYERLKTSFQTNAQEIYTILGTTFLHYFFALLFPIL